MLLYYSFTVYIFLIRVSLLIKEAYYLIKLYAKIMKLRQNKNKHISKSFHEITSSSKTFQKKN